MKRSVAIASNQDEGGYKTLPEEVWHLIWNKMSNREQLIFSTVSKRLYEMVPASITEMSIKREANPASSAAVLKRFYNLTRLRLIRNDTITDQDILFLTRLQSLELDFAEKIRLSNLKSLTSLTNISFVNLELYHDTPSDYTFLTRLKSMHIRVSSLPDLRGFTNIETLHGFGIKDKILIANAPSLTSLSINERFIVHETTASSLTRVSSLFLSDQNLNNLSITSFVSLTKLVFLFSYGINEEILLKLTNLTTLHFHFCDVSTSFSSSLTNLRDLTLSNVYFTQVHHLKNLTNLAQLSLNFKIMDEQRIDDEFISNFYNLEKLKLYKCTDITDMGIENLTKLSSLKLVPHPEITEKSSSRIKELSYFNLRRGSPRIK